MNWHSFPPHVSAAQRRTAAAKTAAKLTRKGRALSPVRIAGRKMATTFWGRTWCEHLESYSDFENRLPRGRAYARNGSILDLQISPGRIQALVMGSSLYEIAITVAPLSAARWKAIKRACSGRIDSLVGLLQGRFSDAVMRVVADRDRGLFPSPGEIRKECSCPDWADLCKHLAAVLYGVGSRLDEEPGLFFILRGVDPLDLLEAASGTEPLPVGGASTLAGANLSEIFGVDIGAPSSPKPNSSAPPKSGSRKRQARTKKSAPKKTKKRIPRKRR